ncbi:hypothetical protein AC579_9404 [Pseudocercospora musae]|uniref:Uncharacterized protein n=1 Tax=Pseudocercospora musae TaxID=113226 RepID=A0A139HHH3_9PEZI|nr:hypothetical protein AC579_9404 [Pseudocercospora musae]
MTGRCFRRGQRAEMQGRRCCFRSRGGWLIKVYLANHPGRRSSQPPPSIEIHSSRRAAACKHMRSLADMAFSEQVTVDRSYFDALLRRYGPNSSSIGPLRSLTNAASVSRADVVGIRSACGACGACGVCATLDTTTCLSMSRTAYRACKIDFFPDECDVPLPARATITRPLSQGPIKKTMSLSNRFDMLNVHGARVASNERSREPHDSAAQSDNNEHEHDTIDISTPPGVSLRFLDDDAAD